MNNDELIRKLNSVGKTIFTEYYELFKSYYDEEISKEECIDHLINKDVSNYNGASIRCGNAKLIFEAHKEIDALRIVSDSSRLSVEVIQKAKSLIVKF